MNKYFPSTEHKNERLNILRINNRKPQDIRNRNRST